MGTFPSYRRALTHTEKERERERDGGDVEAGRDLGPRGRLRGARAHQERCRDQVQPHPRHREDGEKYEPVVQPDGGQLSDWKPLYQPTKEEEEEDRKRAYETGVPHGYIPRGNRYQGMPTIKLHVQSEIHEDDEYGARVNQNGKHSGGPFVIQVSPKMTVEDLRLEIKDKGGIIPGMQKLAYAGKKLDDPKRTLEHYGVSYWHKKFPDWPITIRKL